MQAASTSQALPYRGSQNRTITNSHATEHFNNNIESDEMDGLEGLDDFGDDSDFGDQLDHFMESDHGRPDDSELDSFFEDLSTIDGLEVQEDGSLKQTKTKLEDIEEWLFKREWKPEKTYGMFTRDATVLKFFNDKNNENILADIRQKNATQKMGNVKIPGTEIELINYSYCPKCNAVYSFKDIMNYFRNPVKEDNINRKLQYRQDTRIHCQFCDTYFLPSIVISDGTPKNEVQGLCRMQTIDAVESFYQQRKKRVLTENQSNILKNEKGLKAIVNDVRIADLKEKPTLIANLIQYTPAPLILSFVEEQNLKKRDLLYGAWFKSGGWRALN